MRVSISLVFSWIFVVVLVLLYLLMTGMDSGYIIFVSFHFLVLVGENKKFPSLTIISGKG